MRASVPPLRRELSPDGRRAVTALLSAADPIPALGPAVSWLRLPDPANFRGAPLWLSLIGVGLLAVSGWLGGKMVYVHGIAVDAAPDTTPPGRR